MLELDELFLVFLDKGYDQLTPDECEIFEQFLETKDQDLLDWMLLQSEPKEGAYKSLIDKIRRASLS